MLINKEQITYKLAILQGTEKITLHGLFFLNEKENSIPIEKELIIEKKEVNLNIEDFGFSIKIENNTDELGNDDIFNEVANESINKAEKKFSELL